MIRVQYEDELVTDPATQSRAIVIVEMTKWEEHSNELMLAEINYLSKDPISGSETVIAGKVKPFKITVEKYNEMFLGTNHLIPAELTPFEKSVLRKKLCLLLYVKNDFLEGTNKCIFNTEPEKWIIC